MTGRSPAFLNQKITLSFFSHTGNCQSFPAEKHDSSISTGAQWLKHQAVLNSRVHNLIQPVEGRLLGMAEESLKTREEVAVY